MISFEEAIQIHELLIVKFGGSAGLRDPEALKSALARPYQTFEERDLYQTLCMMRFIILSLEWQKVHTILTALRIGLSFM